MRKLVIQYDAFEAGEIVTITPRLWLQLEPLPVLLIHVDTMLRCICCNSWSPGPYRN